MSDNVKDYIGYAITWSLMAVCIGLICSMLYAYKMKADKPESLPTPVVEEEKTDPDVGSAAAMKDPRLIEVYRNGKQAIVKANRIMDAATKAVKVFDEEINKSASAEPAEAPGTSPAEAKVTPPEPPAQPVTSHIFDDTTNDEPQSGCASGNCPSSGTRRGLFGRRR